jgi:hypothetical protein
MLAKWCARPLVCGLLLLAAVAWTGSARAQSSQVATDNEVAAPLPGDPGGTVSNPEQRLAPNQIMFVVKSEHPRVVDIAFYSDQRRHAWPGFDRVYTIRDYKVHNYVLNCTPGEKICYGAGVRNNYRQYWGVGVGRKHRCGTCCFVCDGKRTRQIVLNP